MKKLFILLLLCFMSVQLFADFTKKNDVLIAEGDVEVNKMFSPDKVTKTKYKIFYHAKKKVPYVEFRFEAVKYCFYFSLDDVKKINTAFNNYVSDFESKNLNKKDKKSYKKYGEFKGLMDWGTLLEMKTGEADVKYQLGYFFKNKSPYFSITIWPASNKKYKEGESHQQQSVRVNLYFTKAQAKTFIESFDEEYIKELINESFMNESPDKDSYSEKEAFKDDYHEADFDENAPQPVQQAEPSESPVEESAA